MASLESPPVDGDRNRGPALAIITIILDVLATVSVLARLYVKSRISKQLGLDDAFIVMSLTTWIVVGIFIAFAIHYGLGRHVYYLSLTPELLANKTQAMKWQFFAVALAPFSFLFTRISICLFVLRVFGVVPNWKRILYCVIAFVTITNLPFAIIVVTQCKPMRKVWDPLAHGKCVSPVTVKLAAYGSGVVSTICDWILASLPILCLWKIQMRPRLKAGICVLMAMGFFSGICAIIRMALTTGAVGDDQTWDVFNYDIAATLEQDLGILAACIPTLKPLFRSRRSAKEPARQQEDQRPLHHHLNESTPSSLLARTGHECTGTHGTATGPSSLNQEDEVGLERLDKRGVNREIGLKKTVDITCERFSDR